MLKKIGYAILGGIALIYLINPTAGVIELIPDNIPIVGNLDEFAASALLIKAIRVLFGKNNNDDNDMLDERLIKRSKFR